MAKLHSYYVLCPLIDQKSFLGVSNDKETENVLVTLGRNVVHKYRLTDQKQIGGWTSKDHITSTVIYDKEQDAFVGVFNNNTIKIWKHDAENLEKVKKYKFPLHIAKLLPRGDHSSLILFLNGNCASLSYGIENRKAYEGKSLIKNNESIVDVACYTYKNADSIAYIVRNNNKYCLTFCPLRNELGDLEKAKLTKVKIERPENDVYVVGKLISVKDHPVVYILWSDSKMAAYDLITKSWKTIGNVPWISTATSVSLAWMGENHLILFGSSTEQEGAIIVAYNVSLGVGSCRYPMKIYTEDAKLYCFDNRIILEASNHIGMLPYVVETSRSLSSLLASHDVIQDETTIVADWGTSKKMNYNFTKDVKNLIQLGLTERNICAQIVPTYLEKNNTEQIITVLSQFKDIPESILVSILSHVLTNLNINEVDVTSKAEFMCALKDNPKKGASTKPMLNLLNSLLETPFSDALLIPHLRNSLSLNDALFLMTYTSHLLTESDELPNEFETKLINWCTLIMDAFYQQFLMTKDVKVTNVLNSTREVIVKLVDELLLIDSSLPMLQKLVSGKVIEENNSLSYTIELMQI